jgi:hypothetical protein
VPVCALCRLYAASKGYEFEVAVFGVGTQVGRVSRGCCAWWCCGVAVAASCAGLHIVRLGYSLYMKVVSMACLYLQRLFRG